MFTPQSLSGAVVVGLLLVGVIPPGTAPVPAAVPPVALAQHLLGTAAFHATAEYPAPGTYAWTAPPGVQAVLLELWGAGGGGSRPFGYQAAGHGGGAGAYVRTVVTVVPNRTYSLTVGAGGAGAAPPSPFGTPGTSGGVTGFADVFAQVLTFAGGGSGGNSAADGHGGVPDAAAQIHRDGKNGAHGGGITPGFGGKALVGSLEPPSALGGGSGGVGQINASGGSGSPGYAILSW